MTETSSPLQAVERPPSAIALPHPVPWDRRAGRPHQARQGCGGGTGASIPFCLFSVSPWVRGAAEDRGAGLPARLLGPLAPWAWEGLTWWPCAALTCDLYPTHAAQICRDPEGLLGGLQSLSHPRGDSQMGKCCHFKPHLVP